MQKIVFSIIVVLIVVSALVGAIYVTGTPPIKSLPSDPVLVAMYELLPRTEDLVREKLLLDRNAKVSTMLYKGGLIATIRGSARSITVRR